MNILITGGAGFIGSHLVRHFVQKYPDYQIFNLDLLTYAGNLANLQDIENADNYTFIKADIQNLEQLRGIFAERQIQAVMHCAAESHVDRSITDPLAFVRTNVMGTTALLQAAREYWEGNFSDKLFYHISTDEVYGALGNEGFFLEDTAYDPRSPYSASKASSDHFVRAYHHTYGLPIKISNCSNNYGPYQFPEKLVPLFINNILNQKSLPVYGAGTNVRDWLYVEDHVHAIDTIFHKGVLGETYNIGGHNEWRNIDLIYKLCDLMDEKIARRAGSSRNLITFVKDRAGHDFRYAIDATKIKEELGWVPSLQFEEGLAKTIDWYLNNQDWLQQVTSGDYMHYYDRQYGNK